MFINGHQKVEKLSYFLKAISISDIGMSTQCFICVNLIWFCAAIIGPRGNPSAFCHVNGWSANWWRYYGALTDIQLNNAQEDTMHRTWWVLLSALNSLVCILCKPLQWQFGGPKEGGDVWLFAWHGRTL